MWLSFLLHCNLMKAPVNLAVYRLTDHFECKRLLLGNCMLNGYTKALASHQNFQLPVGRSVL